ncbi:MAG: TnpV protein [Lachnospiraceae bacterium]
MNLTYQQNGDYLIPNLTIEDTGERLTKYGLMRRTYLKEEKKGIYVGMLLEDTLMKHLMTIQGQAEERMELLMKQMQKEEGVDEQLKAQDQMLWVQRMNNIKNRAEEIILQELIYQ